MAYTQLHSSGGAGHSFPISQRVSVRLLQHHAESRGMWPACPRMHLSAVVNAYKGLEFKCQHRAIRCSSVHVHTFKPILHTFTFWLRWSQIGSTNDGTSVLSASFVSLLHTLQFVLRPLCNFVSQHGASQTLAHDAHRSRWAWR